MQIAKYETKLDEYLSRQKRGAARRLAEKTGIKSPIICRIRTGKLLCTVRWAALIEKATDGELRAEDLCEARIDLQTISILRGLQ